MCVCVSFHCIYKISLTFNIFREDNYPTNYLNEKEGEASLRSSGVLLGEKNEFDLWHVKYLVSTEQHLFECTVGKKNNYISMC